MPVESGQMPYQYTDRPLPVRTQPGAWPGLETNIGMSGRLIEEAMFVYNAELRKWNFPDQLDLLQFHLYSHPDVTPSGFEPKANGDTLEGLVGGIAALESIDNIEEMRERMDTFLFSFYAGDSVYGSADFLNAWLQTAYPESPSGGYRITQPFPPLNIFSITGRTFLHPELESVTGGDLITTLDTHWLGGSGVIFDIDCGEVIFNPFPFPREGFESAASSNNFRFQFGPIYPNIQTTAGNLPSIEVSRYQSDVQAGRFKQETNFDAIASGYVQIDGYCLLEDTLIELVKGNDDNVEADVSFANDYTGHIQGLRPVRDGAGENDPSARCYRLPTAQSSGLYRVLTHNTKDNVPDTAIPSGFVSLWPQGQVRKLHPGGTLAPAFNNNFIDGQQNSATSEGNLDIDSDDARGIHVLDDAIWIAGPNVTGGSGTFDSRGMFVCSPYTGHMVWYRPAELTLATSGNAGNPTTNAPGHFGVHFGLMDIGSDFVRLSKVTSQFFTFETSPAADTGVYTLHFQRYNKTTLDHTEQSEQFTFEFDNSIPDVSALRGAFSDGGAVYTWREFGGIIRFTTGLSFNGYFVGSGPDIAGRRHYAGGDLLYTLTGNVHVGDPIRSMTPPGGSSSGIGKWSISSEPGSPGSDTGVYTHDSAKRLRAEDFFGHESIMVIHSIFEVSGATHVRDGIWMLMQFSSPGGFIQNTELYLCRIVEESTEWRVVEVLRTGEFLQVIGSTGLEFPVEGILHDID